MRALFLFFVLCIFPLPTSAQDVYRFNVWGTFTLTTEGTVGNVNYRGRPPRALEEFVQSSMALWRFDPIVEDGSPVSIQVSFGFELVGISEGDEVVVTMHTPRFSELLPIRPTNFRRPEYPRRALFSGAEAEVHVEFLIGPDGRVTDAHVSTVGLVRDTVPRATSQNRLVREFAEESRQTVRRWIYPPPANGLSATGRQCFVFRMVDSPERDRQEDMIWHDLGGAPWQQERGERVAGDAPVDGEVSSGDDRIRRLPDAVPGA